LNSTTKLLLSHPQILRAAWRRVRHWYAYGDQPPEPEFSRWCSDEDGQLRAFSERLLSDEVLDLCLPLIPYPKKGSTTRHFCRPSVEVQLYFATFAVLLAPWLEKSMHPCSFGNRWFRGLYRKRDSSGMSVWQERPFTLEDRNAYQPYPRAYGMFRRVAHWTSQAMVGESRTDAATRGSKHEVLPEDYYTGAFPRFVRHDWWNRGASGKCTTERGYWAEIDLELAYPSVRIPVLRRCLRDMVLDDDQRSLGGMFLDYPHDITRLLQGVDIRLQLVDRLCDALERVSYNTKDAIGNFWLPDDVCRRMPIDSGEGHPGLPTGLLISGLLLNTYLNPIDTAMMDWGENGGRWGKGAFLRFADDMRVLARTPETLFEGIDILWEAICLIGTEVPEMNLVATRGLPVSLSLPGAHNSSNLRINFDKLGPDPLQTIITSYCDAECRGEDGKRRRRQQPNRALSSSEAERNRASTLQQWWTTSIADGERLSFEEALKRQALTAGNLNAFVTLLVERMSELGGDGLQERFGAEARQRLTDLHQLVRFEIDDKQVRADTRLSFGTGKLVRAWLPETSADEDRDLIYEIRESVGLALHKAPWKTSLWRAVLRAAVRRPCGGDKGSTQDQQKAESWLQRQLESIQHPDRVKSQKSGYTLAWWTLWPEPKEDGTRKKDPDRLRAEARVTQALSAHRAAFWHALRDTITDLDRAISATEEDWDDGGGESSEEWASREWTFRAIPEEELKPVRAWLARLDVWCGLLYPIMAPCYNDEKLAARWGCSRYEIEALSLAVLRCVNPLIVMGACDGTAVRQWTGNPALLAGRFADDPRSISGWAGWVVAHTRPVDDKLRVWMERLLPGPRISVRHWPLYVFDLMQAVPSIRRAELVSAWSRGRGMHNAGEQIKLLRQMRMQSSFPVEAHTSLHNQAQLLLVRIQDIIDEREVQEVNHLWLLQEYAWVRKALLGFNDAGVDKNDPNRFSLHRLLWGIPWSHKDSGRWPIEPGSVTAMGLPLRIACRLLEHALRQYSGAEGVVIGDPPVWLLRDTRTSDTPSPRSWLADGRRCQFDPEGWERFESQAVPLAERTSNANIKPWIHCSEPAGWRDDWEVLPHPLYLMPGVVRSEMDPAAYVRWCHQLHFLTAARGDEALLDTLFESGAGSVPFEDRWHWRHHIHMPQVFWREFDGLTRLALGRSLGGRSGSLVPMDPDEDALLRELQAINASPPRPLDFRWERVNIQLSEDDPWDLPVAVLPYGQSEERNYWRGIAAPLGEEVSKAKLAETFPVRIGQVSEHPDWSSFVSSGMRLNRTEIQAVMRQIAGVFLHDVSKGKEKDDAMGARRTMVILPEATLPNSERTTILHWARESKCAVLAGCLWRRLGNAVAPHRALRSMRVYLSNEALLSLPLTDNGNDDWAPVRQFTLQKPMPAHIEYGLALALSHLGGTGRSWHMSMGSRWYLFAHHRWGKFTVAICSDLIDPAPWNNLRGQIQHLITCAYNQDVDLYEAMTWVRAYENFTNVVLVNHGEHGGSFVWTPKHNGHKEVVKLRGSELNLIADVELPVSGLMEAQQSGVEEAILNAQNEWLGVKPGRKGEFKAPPPGYLFTGEVRAE